MHIAVLVATPEKYDLISRGWRGEIGSDGSSSGKDFIKDVRLLIIDEIHLLGEERGAVLEAIVSRTRFISRLIDAERQESGDTSSQKYESTRIVGLSTAVANPYDLADWIGIDVDGIQNGSKIGLYNFRPSVRPVSTVSSSQHNRYEIVALANGIPFHPDSNGSAHVRLCWSSLLSTNGYHE